MRKVLSVVLAWSLLAAGLTAPLVHAHPDAHASDHHDGDAVHAHWGGHEHAPRQADEPSLDASNHDRAIYLNPFLAEAGAPLPDPGVMPGVFTLPVPPERTAVRRIEVVRSHDPPARFSTAPRPPPPFLS